MDGLYRRSSRCKYNTDAFLYDSNLNLVELLFGLKIKERKKFTYGKVPNWFSFYMLIHSFITLLAYESANIFRDVIVSIVNVFVCNLTFYIGYRECLQWNYCVTCCMSCSARQQLDYYTTEIRLRHYLNLFAAVLSFSTVKTVFW